MTVEVEIYVPLVGEAVDVWRPVRAVSLGGDLYRIADQAYDRTIETWEFEPGDLVTCEARVESGARFVAAVARSSRSSGGMALGYFGDPGRGRRSVLLIFGDDTDAMARLHDAANQLASGEDSREVRVDRLPGFRSVDGCSLVAEVGMASLGVGTVDESAQAFRCVLDREGWTTVAGLLDPFVARTPTRQQAFQHLTDTGTIDWIVSTSRQWQRQSAEP